MNLSACSGCGLSRPPTAQALVGWVLESPGRGTLGLIVSCLFTIFLCTWVVIHPRVCSRPLVQRLHKITLFLKTITAPEFIAVEGLQERSQAQKMVKKCAGPTGGCLKLVHAFYIGMLALRYRTPQGEKVIWPNQYTWLLEQGMIDWDNHALWGLSEENLRDKSNADGTAKLLALGQVFWFVAQSIMRRVHMLPLSQLEAMTLSYVLLFAITYFFWWPKPKDVLTPSIIDLPDMLSGQKSTFEAMATIWYLTPRVFEKEAADKALQEAQQNARREAEKKAMQETRQSDMGKAENRGNCKKVQPTACLPVDFKASAKEIVLACWDPELYHSRVLWPLICVFGASFGALHLISWHTGFPTLVESWLWRVAALVSIISMLIFMLFERVILRRGEPLTIISLVSPAMYLLSRIVMIGGVVASFRASDPAIYNTYVVSTYWIHIL
ncbi:hypothetical protein BDR22DRAFT_825134 [Usnea florida]